MTPTASSIAVHCSHDALVDITEIVANPRNPNKHPDKQVALLAKIIRHQGWRAPVVVSKRSGFVVAGHGRLEAAKLLQVQVVPVNFQEFATEADEWAHVIADNRIAELAKTDGAMLKDLLIELDSATQDFDMDLSGFDAGELERVINSFGDHPVDAEPQTDRAAELQKQWGTATGQLWALDEHRLLCGDSTKREDVERVFGGAKSDLCFTSPPYALGRSIKLSGNTTLNTKDSCYDEHEDDSKDWPALMDGWFSASEPHVKSWIVNVQLLAGNKLSLIDWIHARKDRVVDVAVWDKGHAQPAMAPGILAARHEWLIVVGDAGAKRTIPFSSWRGTIQSVYEGPPQRSNEFAAVHGATMPIHLPMWVLRDLCDRAASVYDPFLGSGTTLIAAEGLGRKCYGLEISPGYCAVILQRFKDATGKMPTLIPNV